MFENFTTEMKMHSIDAGPIVSDFRVGQQSAEPVDDVGQVQEGRDVTERDFVGGHRRGRSRPLPRLLLLVHIL
jgi:hypothetical protein